MPSEEWEKKIGLADHYGTLAEVSFHPAEAEDEYPFGSVAMRCGNFHAIGTPTPTAARQLAAALMDLADCLEEAT